MLIKSFALKIFLLGILSILIACEQGPDDPDSSIQQLPDWSGWWHQVPGAANNGQAWLNTNTELYLPNAKKPITTPVTYCIPARFNGLANGSQFTDVEFLLMPGRVTITNADNMLRRIYTDGRVLPENPDYLNGGNSVGRWEEDTLVIETIGLHPDTTFPVASRPTGWLIGEDVHVLERYSLDNQGQLIAHVQLSAPEMLKETLTYTNIYERWPSEEFIYGDHDVCSPNDRSIDPDTGEERFDLTPPEGLPPPPTR